MRPEPEVHFWLPWQPPYPVLPLKTRSLIAHRPESASCIPTSHHSLPCSRMQTRKWKAQAPLRQMYGQPYWRYPAGTLPQLETNVPSWKDSDPWYLHPVYERYWQHYYQGMAWLQNHRLAYRKALESYANPMWYFSAVSLNYSNPAEKSECPWSSYGPHSGPQSPQGAQLHPWGSWQHPRAYAQFQTCTRETAAFSLEGKMVSESDEEIECDLSNMQITPELREYFEQTERHKEERRRLQQLEEERLSEYVNADHDLYFSNHRSVEPPSGRPDERRKAEMKRLYGDSATKIMAMEAAVQLSFNKLCDRKRPKYWPVIPLKF
ncbi:gem-associated protein 8 [Tenrec ecaudatus]|uniref:gem-associated protein 8 n=1 Tax=Tenrec ecaudatus TaxID=94439 RepID=UPI003F59B758